MLACTSEDLTLDALKLIGKVLHHAQSKLEDVLFSHKLIRSVTHAMASMQAITNPMGSLCYLLLALEEDLRIL